MSKAEKNRLSFMKKFCYGLGDCSANVVVALSGTFLSAYYTDSVGIAATAVGTMLLVCRVFDGGSDLLTGALIDKTTSRFGKARPWMLGDVVQRCNHCIPERWCTPLPGQGVQGGRYQDTDHDRG